MEKKIRIGICGYGNLGHGVELAVNRAADMELVGVFSRRDLPGTDSGVPAINLKHVLEYKDKIDVMILCGGSATDLIDQGPELAQNFVTVDSFDTHPRIPEHFANMEAVTKANNTAAIISVGWDPGLFSLLRVLGDSVLPEGKSYTFWGKGVSQGHSDAIRRIPGVKNGKQYTIPKQEYLDAVRSGKGTDAPGNVMHLRECFVVPEEGADLNAIETAIKTMPNYFVGYETTVHFISEEEFAK
ncbi:MAG: diaminopimelate dehydrogenase, partial [Acidaminococcaceae bacterium]|nr:diaminopimelate dehydrogenase [Acidaminococcaceae bacterium]